MYNESTTVRNVPVLSPAAQDRYDDLRCALDAGRKSRLPVWAVKDKNADYYGITHIVFFAAPNFGRAENMAKNHDGRESGWAERAEWDAQVVATAEELADPARTDTELADEAMRIV